MSKRSSSYDDGDSDYEVAVTAPVKRARSSSSSSIASSSSAASRGSSASSSSAAAAAALAKRRKALDAQKTPEQLAVSRESSRLKERARGTLIAAEPSTAPIVDAPRALCKYNGENITNKLASRGKKRYLLAFPGRFDALVTDGATLGSLAQLNTSNPIMYIMFGELGRLRLNGTIVYPKRKYLAINYQQRETTKMSPLTCRGTFDSVIVFPEFYWIGRKAENPTEQPMDFPASLRLLPSALVQLQEEEAKAARALLDAEALKVKQREERSARYERKHTSTTSNTSGSGGSGVGGGDSKSDDNDVQVLLQRRPSRAAASAANEKMAELISSDDSD